DLPDDTRTRASLRRAEYGFLGVVVWTRVHPPRRWGAPFRAGVLVFVTLACRPLRTSWAIVGTRYLSLIRNVNPRCGPVRGAGAPTEAAHRRDSMRAAG